MESTSQLIEYAGYDGLMHMLPDIIAGAYSNLLERVSRARVSKEEMVEAYKNAVNTKLFGEKE